MNNSVKFKQKSSLLWIMFNILRIIPNVIFGSIFFLFYFFKWLFTSKKTFNDRKTIWEDACKNIDQLKRFFRTNYKYKYDLGMGFFDHDSSYFEWILNFGDCDDMALYSKKALKKMGYEAYRIGIIGMTKWKFESKYNLKPVLHFDCLFVNKDKDNNTTYNLFNYGIVVTGKSVEDVLNNLSNIYSSSFPKDHTKVCFCLY